jgi:pyridoxamine 5'-phosphate oxidase family protein
MTAPPFFGTEIHLIAGRVLAVYERGDRRCGDRMGEMDFTQAELEFVRSQRIGRLATVGPSGWPHVAPVMYTLDASGAFEFDVDGVKLRNLNAEPRAAIVIDAMGPKRGVAVQGQAELIGPERARLTGVRKFSWGL